MNIFYLRTRNRFNHDNGITFLGQVYVVDVVVNKGADTVEFVKRRISHLNRITVCTWNTNNTSSLKVQPALVMSYR